jgi:hypothetical protein
MWDHALLLIVLVVLLAWLVYRWRAGDQAAVSAAYGGGGGGGGGDSYPYWHKDLPPPSSMFRRLAREKPRVVEDKGMLVVQRKWPQDWTRCDALSNHFSEKIRVRCQTGPKPSPWDTWNDDKARLAIIRSAEGRKGKQGSSHSLREAIYRATRACNTFNPTFGLWVLRRLARGMNKPMDKLRVLDPSAGWGDRLIAACAGKAFCYHGYDPDEHLADAYRAIADQFCPGKPCNYWVRTMPFEQAGIAPGSYDVVLTSPPFFTLEVYPGHGADHGNVSYPQWLAGFYTSYLALAWRAVAQGGYLALYVSDIGRHHLGEDTVAIVERLGGGLPKIYGLQTVRATARAGGGGPVRPMLVWKKR